MRAGALAGAAAPALEHGLPLREAGAEGPRGAERGSVGGTRLQAAELRRREALRGLRGLSSARGGARREARPARRLNGEGIFQVAMAKSFEVGEMVAVIQRDALPLAILRPLGEGQRPAPHVHGVEGRARLEATYRYKRH